MAGDPFWTSVTTLLFNDNAANGTTTFADQSASPLTFARTGNTVYSNAQAPSGMTTSVLFDGSGDWVRNSPFTNNAAYNYAGPSNAPFTIEGFLYYTSVAGSQVFWDNRNSGTDVNAPTILSDGTNINFLTTGANRISGAMPSVSTWSHIALCRDASANVRLFKDGTQIGSTFVSGTNYASRTVTVGANVSGTANYSGYMACVRVTKAARYTANFTPPTLPLPTFLDTGGPSPHFDRRKLTGGLISMRDLVRDVATGLLLPRPGLILPRGY